MSEQRIEDGVIVAMTYLLTDAETGKILDRNAGGEPFVFLQGSGQVLKGLETGLTGLTEGSDFDLTLQPVDAYGERKGPGPQAVKRSEFRRDIAIREGMRFKAENSQGEEVPLWITKVAGSRVYVDNEHPLTGKTLRFTGEVVMVREATAEETEHGHAHGLTGQGHTH